MLKRSRANVQPRHRRFDRLSPHQHLHRIWALRVGDLVGGRADRAAAQQVERAVVGDPEQPGAQWRHLLQLVHGDEGPDEGVLHHILALDHRAHQARADAPRPRIGGGRLIADPGPPDDLLYSSPRSVRALARARIRSL